MKNSVNMLHKMIITRFIVFLLCFNVANFSCSHVNSQKVEYSINKGDKREMKKKYKYTNLLVNETSPYLLQHAHNPVNWYPWNDKALEKSRIENKPIFLSIGYSACHWCHVMAHESFENEEIARFLNEHFINIKVDREERPDLDKIYMDAVQILTGGGGWPLSVFLTPDLNPFYGGTYFPPEDRYGIGGFKTLIVAIADAWSENRKDIINNSKQLTYHIIQNSEKNLHSTAAVNTEIFEKATTSLSATFDLQNGGFGSAPKFPRSMAIEFLMRQYSRTQDAKLLRIITMTLDKMASGGIYDHLGGGFHRYSVDKKWHVPHFEKMLYDNALLSDLYLKAYQLTGNQLYRKVAIGIFEYVLREITDETGTFHSTQDADSKSEEGKFYIWRYQEIIDALGEKDGNLFCTYYSVKKEGNFNSQEEYHANQNILHRKSRTSPIEYNPGLSSAALEKKIDSLCSVLYTIRSKRPLPGKDDKIITAWNGLMISSFVHGYQILGTKKYLDAAEKATRFILSEMYTKGKLRRIFRNGVAKQPAYLDDYAFFIISLIDLYEATFNLDWLIKAEELNNKMTDYFWDDNSGGFFFTSASHRDLITRTKPSYDGAIPSGNSIAAYALLRLSKFFNNKEYYNKAEEIFKIFGEEIRQTPQAYMAMLKAVDFYLFPPKEIAFAGKINSNDLNKLLATLHSEFVPNKVIAFIDNLDEKKSSLEKMIPLLKDKIAISGKATAYVCKNFTCQLPVTEPENLKKVLQKGIKG